MSCQIFPILNDSELLSLNSSAEASFYKACKEQLPKRFLVFHSLSIIDLSFSGLRSLGECDFVICDPNSGILIVEVKGGGIEFNPSKKNSWFSINRNGKRFEIKNPFRQSENYRHRIVSLLKEKTRVLKNIFFPAGHSVAFPDISTNSLGKIISHDRPRDIIACAEDIHNLTEWFEKSVNFWNGKISNFKPLGNFALNEIKKVFLKPILAEPTLSVVLNNEEKERIKLTDIQTRLIYFLENFNRANIQGGAGTGKTVLAKHLAKKKSEEGKKVLLICFNRLLGEEIKNKFLDDNNVICGSYHSVFQNVLKHQFEEILQIAENDLSTVNVEEYWSVLRPYAYSLGIERNSNLNFDCIIIDEAQDFGEDSWLPIELLMKEEVAIYTFSDTNQNLYSKRDNVPKLSSPFLLNRNCRNTKKIHDYSYKGYVGPKITPPEIIGEDLKIINELNHQSQIKEIFKIINKLVNNEKIQACDIVVLVADPKTFKYKFEELKKYEKNSLKFIESYKYINNEIFVSNLNTFKGLESNIVIIWGLNEIPVHERDQTSYVGISRAKSLCYLIN